MGDTTRSGQRVGDWFLWIECEVAKTDSYRKIPVVTLRRAISGGDVLATIVASKGIVTELRNAANQIETILNSIAEGDRNELSEATQ